MKNKKILNNAGLPFKAKSDKIKCICGHALIKHRGGAILKRGYFNCTDSGWVTNLAGHIWVDRHLECGTHLFKKVIKK